MKIFTIVSALFLSITLYAGHAGEIAIISPSGEQFYVVLNGQYQNYQPQSNVNFQAYTNNWNKCQIVAADNHFTIDKHITVRPDKKVTYKIMNYHGRHLLQFVSEQPLYSNSGYGNQNGPPNGNSQGMGQCGSSNSNNQSYGYPHGQPYGQPHGQPQGQYQGGGYYNTNYNGYNSNNMMDDQSYQQLKKAVNAESFSDDRLRVANRAARSKRMSVDQIKGIMKIFWFSSEGLDFAKAAYANCVNKSDYYQLLNQLTFSSEKDDLEAFLDQQ
ncbi:MAG: DUF4476 domain-containing protein [Crocinitomicaceae bacterium]|nr:DUF4476 domain-containing protein [Crocinitomicaceae bacterium]